VDPVGSRLNLVQKDSNPETAPASQPPTTLEEGPGVGATERKDGPLPSKTATTAAAVPPNAETPPLPSKTAAIVVPVSGPPASSPAASWSVDGRTWSEPASTNLPAERAAKEAALLEFLHSSEALSIPVVQAENGPAQPENASALGWHSGAALSLLTLGVFTFYQRRSRKRAADESDRKTD
jgi:hypothetical protein